MDHNFGQRSWDVDEFGNLTGTPTAIGAYNVVARVQDAGSPGQMVDVPFTLTVENPPVITTTSLPDATAGQFYSTTLNATGGTPPLQWGAGGMGVNDNEIFTLQMNVTTGVLSGIPRASGTYLVNVSVTDAIGILAFTQMPMNIQPGPLTFQSGAFPNGKVGVRYQDLTPFLNANGGTPPISFTMVGGTVPPGLTISGPILSGIPTTSGTYTMMLQATDSSSPPQSLTATFTITINP